jgi:hypothetical protein
MDVLRDIGEYRRARFFKELYEVAHRLLPDFDPLLSEVFDLQEKIQRKYTDENEYHVTYRANLYEYITQKDTQLVTKTTNYRIDNLPIEDRFEDWFAFMNFARKNKGWQNKIEQVA